VEEKNRIGFVPGLALILGALAIALFIINSIKKNPAVELLEHEMRGRIVQISEEVGILGRQVAELDPETLQADIRANVGKDLRVLSDDLEINLVKRDIQDIEAALDNIRNLGDPDFLNDVTAIERALKGLKERVRDSQRNAIRKTEGY